MPTAMHPWMDPLTETRLWPHDNQAIYDTYDRIFDSKRHGWANLQSMHVNLPFADDAQFARLHAAIRLVLPILPALAASSPIAEQRHTGCADYRMQVYWNNSDAVPTIAGQVIPETVSTRAEYEELILAPMYRDIAPFDPQRILRHEWLNSRGAIARFDRNAIEIRVVDTQECPQADLAIAAAASSVVRRLYRNGETGLAAQQAIATQALAAILRSCIADAEQAMIDNTEYLALLGFPGRRCNARDRADVDGGCRACASLAGSAAVYSATRSFGAAHPARAGDRLFKAASGSGVSGFMRLPARGADVCRRRLADWRTC
jgi:hypothetical protein